jgi:hypothetical protein
MMRPTKLASLMLVWLVANVALAGDKDSQGGANVKKGKGPERTVRAANVPPSRNESTSDRNLSWYVEGWGKTKEEAREDALKKIPSEVNANLAEQGVVLNWQPTPNFVRSLVKDWGKSESKDIEGVGPMEQIQLKVEITPHDYRQMVKMDREERAEGRMMFLGKVLAGLVALLVAVGGYFRLEEATKGYYTTWLRLGVVGLISTVGVGLWLLS